MKDNNYKRKIWKKTKKWGVKELAKIALMYKKGLNLKGLDVTQM